MPPKLHRKTDLKKYVDRIRAGGKDYYYFRHGGHRWPLPDDPTSPAWHEAYAQRLRQAETDHAPRTFAPRTVGALMTDYKASAEHLALAPKTRVDYCRMLDRMAPIAGELAEDIQRSHVRELALELIDKPRTHKFFSQVVSRLFSFAIDNDYCLTNPAARMKRIGRAESYLPWPDDACAQFEASSPPDWMVRCYMLARYTGQRLGDVLEMTWRQYDGAGIAVQQSKTLASGGDLLWIYAHKRLRDYLDGLPRDALLMVVMPSGSAWKATTASKYMNTWLDDIGLGDLNVHGLRHRSGKELADAGCSGHMIQAVLGHRTLQMVENYTRRANQKRLSTAAIKRLESRGRG